jgi:hypothetical protein
VGSQLFFKSPLLKGSVVEVLVDRERLQFLVHNPEGGTELQWQNTRTVPKTYKWAAALAPMRGPGPHWACHLQPAACCPAGG